MVFDSNGSFLTIGMAQRRELARSRHHRGSRWEPYLVTVVYVADTGNDRVLKFDGAGALLATIGTSGSGEGEFTAPQGVAIDVGNVGALMSRTPATTGSRSSPARTRSQRLPTSS